MKSNALCKRACAIVVSILLLCCVSFSAFAASTIEATPTTGSLTIYKYAGAPLDPDASPTGNELDRTTIDRKPLANVEFTYLKVADITQVSTGGAVSLKYKLTNAAVATALGLDTTTEYTSDALNTAMSNKLAATTNTATKNALETAVASGTKMKTDATGGCTKNGIPLGLYLVVETKTPSNVSDTTDPFFVSVPMTNPVVNADGNNDWNYNVFVYPKNQVNTPTLNKLVKENDTEGFKTSVTASMGDTLTYQLTSTMPKITSSATYLKQYTFEDKVDAGIAYNDDSTIVIGTGADAITLTKGTDYTATIDNTTNHTLKIEMTAAGLTKINPAASGKTMVVTYTAKVKSDNTVKLGGDDTAGAANKGGNTNNVTLTWSRTSDPSAPNTVPATPDFVTSLTDKATVYTYGIKLKKEFAPTGGTATNVIFTVKNTTDSADVKFEGSDGVYYASTADTASANVSPKADGTLVLNGLEADTYKLTETKTDAGYSLLKSPIEVVISAATTETDAATEHTGSGMITRTASAKVDGTDVTMEDSGANKNAIVPTITVTNVASFTLPQTGGAGSIVFTLLGAVVFAAAVVFLRKGKKDN